MKRIGILISALLLFALTAMAQDSSAASTTGTASTDTTKQQNRDAAAADDNAAQQAKENAKNADTKQGEEHEKAVARLDDGGKIMNQLITAPDNGIPQDVLEKAKCVAVIPSMIKGGFIFGAEHGRGVATCRLPNGGWSAPAFFTATGGNWGAQIGGQATDLVMLIMNDNGMNQLLNSKFKIGADASAAAGPVGRETSASTNWKLQSEILTYSRSRGLYAGAILNGVVVKADQGAMTAYYGHDAGFRPVLTGQAKDPMSGHDRFIAAVRNAHAQATAEKH